MTKRINPIKKAANRCDRELLSYIKKLGVWYPESPSKQMWSFGGNPPTLNQPGPTQALPVASLGNW